MTNADDLKRYEYAPIGGEYFNSNDFPAAKGALEELVRSFGLGDDADGLIEGVNATPEGVAKALNIYSEKYRKVKEDANISDLWEVYKEEFNDREKLIYGLKFSFFSEKKLNEMVDELKERQDRMKRILDGDETANANAINSLNDEINHYKEAISLIREAEHIRIDNLKFKAYTNAREQEIKNTKDNMRKIVGSS